MPFDPKLLTANQIDKAVTEVGGPFAGLGTGILDEKSKGVCDVLLDSAGFQSLVRVLVQIAKNDPKTPGGQFRRRVPVEEICAALLAMTVTLGINLAEQQADIRELEKMTHGN
jgi:hypothetical protein